MTGLSEFYKLQIFLNTVRIAAWFVLDTDRGFLIDYSSIKAIHAVLLVINLVVSSTQLSTGINHAYFLDSFHSARTEQPA